MKKKLLGILILLLVTVLCFAAGCFEAESNDSVGDSSESMSESSSGISESEAENGSIIVTNKQSVMELGDVVKFTAKTENLEGDVLWSSDKPDVVKIASDGVAEALKTGEAKITASIGEYSDSFEITVSVENIPVLNADETLTLYKGNTYPLNPSVSYKGKVVDEDIEFAFASDDVNIASVSNDGEITAVGEGVCNIIVSATYRYMAISATCVVTVINGEFISLDKINVELSTLNYGEYKTGETLAATAYKGGTKVENAEFVWNSENESVVTVSNGVVTVVGVGTTKVGVSYGGMSAVCNVKVTKPEIDTKLAFEYEVLNDFVLPSYEIDDFVTENIKEVLYENKNVYSSGQIDKDLVVGSSKAKSLVIVTEKADYKVSVTVINKIVENKDDLNSITRSLAKLVADASDLGKGFYYDGYVVLKNDIEYIGEFRPIAYINDCAPDGYKGEVFYGSSHDCGFKGEFDGKGHTVSGVIVAESHGGFFGSIIGSAYVHDFRLENVVVKAAYSGGLTSQVYNTAVVENVYVSGEVDSSKATIDSSYAAMGVFTSGLPVGSVTLKNCTVKVNRDFDLSNPEKTKVSVFGYGYTNRDGIFDNCSVIGSDRLYGSCADENAGNIAYEWDLITERVGVTIYETELDYKVAQAEKAGYERDSERCVEASCTEDGTIVMVKDGAEDIVFTVAAKGHIFIDGDVHCQREDCSATFMTVTVDADVKRGLNFAELPELAGKTIKSVNAVKGADTHISFTEKDVRIEYGENGSVKTQLTYVIETDDGSLFGVKVAVWSLIIKTESDMLELKNYLTYDGIYMTGYYKIAADLDMSKLDANGVEYRNVYGTEALDKHVINNGNANYGGFNGVFDGFNHIIANFGTCGNYGGMLMNCLGGGVLKNIKFVGYRANTVESGIVGIVHSGTIENITIEVEDIGGGGINGVLFKRIFNQYDSEKIVLKDITLVNKMTSTILCATVYGSDDGIPNCGNVTLENIKLVGAFTAFFRAQETGVAGRDHVLDNIDLSGVTTMTLEEYENL